MLQARGTRSLLVGSLLVCGLSAPASGQTPFDQYVAAPAALERPCAVGAEIRGIAVKIHVPVGVELSTDCTTQSPGAHQSASSAAMPAREAIDKFLADSVYWWRDLDGVLVVRPRDAWTDGDHFLNRTTSSFQVSQGRLGSAFNAIASAINHVYAAPAEWLLNATPYLAPIQAAFDGGSVIQALNTIVRSRADLGWTLRYCTRARNVSESVLIIDTRDDGHEGRPGTAVVFVPAGSACQ